MKQKTVKPVNEFRVLHTKKVKGHPTYVYAKGGKYFKYLGITHSKITHRTRNIVLEKNPNPNDTKVAYIRPNPEIERIDFFGKPLIGWEFTSKDKAIVSNIIQESNKNEIEKHKKKKGWWNET